MSADQLNRISPDHILLSGDLLLSFEGELSHITIYMKFVNRCAKTDHFQAKNCVERCVGVLRSKVESGEVEQVHNLFVCDTSIPTQVQQALL